MDSNWTNLIKDFLIGKFLLVSRRKGLTGFESQPHGARWSKEFLFLNDGGMKPTEISDTLQVPSISELEKVEAK